jgi:hypothetical protein
MLTRYHIRRYKNDRAYKDTAMLMRYQTFAKGWIQCVLMRTKQKQQQSVAKKKKKKDAKW